MKNLFALSAKALAVLSLSLVLFGACNKSEKPAADALDSDTSYAFGMYMAAQLGGQGLVNLHFDYDAFKEGFKALNEASETRLTPESAMEKINAAVVALRSRNEEQMWIEGQKNLEEGEAYLAQNSTRGGVVVTPSGLQYEVLVQGSGAKPAATDMVRVHYEGTLIDGTVFDSSYERGSPLEFNLDGVIPGWTEGVQLMNEGSTFRFVIPSDLAYGQNGAGSIPPNAVLVFKVELISIIK